MLTGEEQFRRVFVLWNAFWDAREELSNRFHGIDREGLDWFSREKLDESMEADRRVFRGREDLLLHAAYVGEAAGVRCSPEERAAALEMAFRVLQGAMAPERALDQLLEDGFPKTVSFGKPSEG